MNPLRRRFALALAASALLLLPSCFSIDHTVGRGPQHSPPVEAYRVRWFALFGLWPMDDFDSNSLANGSRDYRVTTKFTFVDVLYSAFTSFATFYRQTVWIEK
jgi:hypothetical protein